MKGILISCSNIRWTEDDDSFTEFFVLDSVFYIEIHVLVMAFHVQLMALIDL